MKAPALCILVVEDEPAIRLRVGEALRAAGHRVLTCRSGIEALGVLSSPSDEVPGLDAAPEREPSSEPGRDRVPQLDLVISNVNPREASGLHLFLDVRTISPGTDVILMTSHGGVTDAVAALKEGASDYLLKPFDIDELLLRVSRIAEQRQIRAQLLANRSSLHDRPEGRAVTGSSFGPPQGPPTAAVGPLSAAMKEFERAYLLHTLDTTNGRKAAAAKQLGISRKNLWEKLRAHGINQPAAVEEAK